ncbi:MAG: hypothetical protein ACRD6I_04485 [Candidatus Acidiferrales bacterium]
MFIWTAWGHVAIFYGDYALWLEQASRFARGETPYRDFYWPFPPLALWLTGAFMSLAGSHLATVQAFMAGVFLLITLALFVYASRLAPRRDLALVSATGLVLAFVFSMEASAPLPVGMYTPAAPLGFLVLLIAAVCFFSLPPFRPPGRWPAMRAALLAVCCALAILAKQDFWIPAAYLTAVSLFLLWKHRLPFAAGCAAVAFLAALAAGLAPIVSALGWGTLPQVATGYGMLAQVAGVSLPSWERITAQAAQTALVFLLFLVCLLLTRAISLRRALIPGGVLLAIFLVTAGLHVWMTARIIEEVRAHGLPNLPKPTEEFASRPGAPAASASRLAILRLSHRLESYFLPAFATFLLLLAILWRWKKIDPAARLNLLLLAGLCVAARSRRVWQHTEWFNFILELPVYVYALPLLFPHIDQQRLARSLRVLLVVLLALGVVRYWRFAEGPLTRRGPFPWVDTPRGPARLAPDSVKLYQQLRQALDELDPTRARAVLTIGYTDGLSYFFGRRNPTPLTQGFALSRLAPQDLFHAVQALSPPPILVDSLIFAGETVPAPRLDLSAWEPQVQSAHYDAVDRPYFQRLLQHCRPFRTVDLLNQPIFTVYDCAPPILGGR